MALTKKEKKLPKQVGSGTDKDIERAIAEIKTKFGDDAIMKLGGKPQGGGKRHPPGFYWRRLGSWHRGTAARTSHRSIWTGVLRENIVVSSHDSGSTEKGRHLCVRGCRACARPRIRKKNRRQDRRSACIPARHWRARS